jgi:DNA replication protein DnaC
MSKKIDKVLKKTADGMSKVNTPTSSNSPARSDLPGDPDCEICAGVGYLRVDVPVGHPQFGQLQVCKCRQGQLNQGRRDRLYALSNLDQLSHMNFEDFEPRGRIGLGPLQADSLERAFNHAQQFARSHEGWLLLQGRYGCGKTHLAAAVANFSVEMGIPTLFITVPDLLDTLRFSYNDNDYSFEQRFEEIRKVQLLILDDFGTQNATPWAQEKLFQILNYRYINQLPTVVTTNLALDEIEGRIRSRLEDPELVTRVMIMATDYRRPADDTGHHELSSLSLLGSRTFGTFSSRKNEGLTADEVNRLERALKAAQDYADNPQGWLVFTGPYGSGKTHLAAAVANYRAGLGFRPLFVVVPDLMDHLRATFSPGSTTSYDRRFEDVRTTPLLVLDDLGTQSMTPWVKEKLYQLFNYRYNATLPTVITTADQLDQLDPRILSRMEDRRLCRILGLTAPAYRGEKGKR